MLVVGGRRERLDEVAQTVASLGHDVSVDPDAGSVGAVTLRLNPDVVTAILDKGPPAT